MSSKLLKLEAMVASLEAQAGFNPQIEVITQRDDGSWPEPVTDAATIIERVRFVPEHVLVANQRKIEAMLVAEIEARDAVNASPVARRARRGK